MFGTNGFSGFRDYGSTTCPSMFKETFSVTQGHSRLCGRKNRTKPPKSKFYMMLCAFYLLRVRDSIFDVFNVPEHTFLVGYRTIELVKNRYLHDWAPNFGQTKTNLYSSLFFSLFFDGILPNFVSHFSVERRGKAEISQKVRVVLPVDHK